MIEIEADAARITICGHARFGPPGKDIVCAAASALCEVLRQQYGGEATYGRAEIPVRGRTETAAAVMRAFRELERAYPKYVRVAEPFFFEEKRHES